MIRVSNSPPVQGGKAPNQKVDPTFGTRVPLELPCMGAICAHEPVARSSQYNFTASLRAMATLATLAPLLNFSRQYTRRSSGSNRTAVCAASTSNQLIMVLPCLLIE